MIDPFFPKTKKSSYQPIDIPIIEEKYSATYVGDFCIKTKSGNWSDEPLAIFYNETPPNPNYSNYFGVFVRNRSIYITDGASAFHQPITGVVANNGEIIFSRYRHNYVTSSDGSVFIDGGRDYLRTNTEKVVQIQMINGELQLINKPRFKQTQIQRQTKYKNG